MASLTSMDPERTIEFEFVRATENAALNSVPWLGRGEMLQPMWDAWKAGDRKAALAAIPDELVDDIIVHGSPAQCRAKIQSYFDNGVTTTSLAILGLDPEMKHWQAVKDLAPTAG